MSALPEIRLATKEDVPEILALIKELADFENAPNSVKATPELLANSLTFEPCRSDPDPKPGFAKTFLLIDPSGKVAAFALHFFNYSTWTASPGLFLEDLFVRPEFRRKGYATMLIKKLAQETMRITDGRGRFEWNCLKWNSVALSFYERLGGERMDEWVGIRVDGDRLKRLAES